MKNMTAILKLKIACELRVMTGCGCFMFQILIYIQKYVFPIMSILILCILNDTSDNTVNIRNLMKLVWFFSENLIKRKTQVKKSIA